jgi:hypothetical protein
VRGFSVISGNAAHEVPLILMRCQKAVPDPSPDRLDNADAVGPVLSDSGRGHFIGAMSAADADHEYRTPRGREYRSQSPGEQDGESNERCSCEQDEGPPLGPELRQCASGPFALCQVAIGSVFYGMLVSHNCGLDVCRGSVVAFVESLTGQQEGNRAHATLASCCWPIATSSASPSMRVNEPARQKVPLRGYRAGLASGCLATKSAFQ